MSDRATTDGATADRAGTASAPILTCRGVTKSFGGLTAVDGIDFELYPGEVRGLVGPNGSGKSTTINLLSRHLAMDSGEMTVAGERVEHLDAHQIAARGLARTYQIPRPFATMTVLENVEVSAYFGSTDRRPDDVTAEAHRWVEFVGLGDVPHELPDTITLHQRKLLELARALATRPKVLFLDEVLAGLNPRELQEGIALVHRIKDLGISIVVVEHIMRVILDLCDHLTVLNFGQVIAKGSPQECLREEAVVEAYLGGQHA